MKSEVKNNRHDIAMADIRRPKMGQILLRTIETYIDAVDCDSLMGGIEILKDKDHDIDGHNRFLVDVDKETDLINDAVERSGFIAEIFFWEAWRISQTVTIALT